MPTYETNPQRTAVELNTNFEPRQISHQNSRGVSPILNERRLFRAEPYY